jgi:hypothetical protein
MKQVKTKSGIIICIENNTNSIAGTQLSLLREDKDYKFLGKLSKLTDEDCEEFVGKIGWKNPFSGEYEDIKYKWYDAPRMDCYKNTAKESFITLLKSEGIDTSKEDELLIIKLL